MANPFEHFDVFIASVCGHTFTLLAGCVVTVLLAFAAKYTKLKDRMTWKIDLSVLLIFVFFACFQAWQDQYRAAEEDSAKLSALTVPHLNAQVDFVAFAPSGKNRDGTLLTLELKILNTGAPSVAQNFRTRLHMDGSKIADGKFTLAPPEGGFYTLRSDSGQSSRVYERDFLFKKALDQPIPTNGAVGGIMMAIFPNVNMTEVRRSLVEVTFADVNGKESSVIKPIEREEKLITGKDIQP